MTRSIEVEGQPWRRWPRKLVVTCHDDVTGSVEVRRYVPERALEEERRRNGVLHDGMAYLAKRCEERGREECEFMRDNRPEHQDYWFCHCSACGHRTNTVLADGYRFCPECGRRVRDR